jgi:hypothetical protein
MSYQRASRLFAIFCWNIPSSDLWPVSIMTSLSKQEIRNAARAKVYQWVKPAGRAGAEWHSEQRRRDHT